MGMAGVETVDLERVGSNTFVGVCKVRKAVRPRVQIVVVVRTLATVHALDCFEIEPELVSFQGDRVHDLQRATRNVSIWHCTMGERKADPSSGQSLDPAGKIPQRKTRFLQVVVGLEIDPEPLAGAQRSS